MTARRKAAVRTPRGRGTGSITSYATKGGVRWRFETTAPVDPARPEDGDRNLSRGGFTSYQEAEAALLLLRADVLRRVPQAIGRDTFAGYAQRWVDGYGGSNGTRLYIQRTVDAMEPYIGHLPLADIRPTDLAAAYRGLESGLKEKPSRKRRRRGLAPSTVARYANWVNTIFLAALDEGLIMKNLANSKHAGRPKGEKAKRVKPFTIWNVDELTRFCDWAMAEEEPWAGAFVILSRTGLRSGEVLALRWGDLDFKRNEMRIERALHYDESYTNPGDLGPRRLGRLPLHGAGTCGATWSQGADAWREVAPQGGCLPPRCDAPSPARVREESRRLICELSLFGPAGWQAKGGLPGCCDRLVASGFTCWRCAW